MAIIEVKEKQVFHNNPGKVIKHITWLEQIIRLAEV
jgi:hypothetical protein